ncbi:hypothetical protein SORBI_3009G178650 [Sorghum bicolor]|uniref:Uncharacterized protein n=1 Tax=Sorghum bicolor TaxID=4558 RepID=A0A1Z5R3B3_SORBI|nr:hypothetical protein SORBI_3009G178650 [Sorghum bicolor]
MASAVSCRAGGLLFQVEEPHPMTHSLRKGKVRSYQNGAVEQHGCPWQRALLRAWTWPRMRTDHTSRSSLQGLPTPGC